MDSSEKGFNLPKYHRRRGELRKNATPPERTLWQRLRNQPLGVKFRREQGIGHYIGDFYCAERQLVIELDGDSHCTEHAQLFGQQLDRYFHQLGLRVDSLPGENDYR